MYISSNNLETYEWKEKWVVLIRLDNIVCSFYFKDITQMRDSPFLQNLKKNHQFFFI